MVQRVEPGNKQRELIDRFYVTRQVVSAVHEPTLLGLNLHFSIANFLERICSRKGGGGTLMDVRSLDEGYFVLMSEVLLLSKRSQIFGPPSVIQANHSIKISKREERRASLDLGWSRALRNADDGEATTSYAMSIVE